MGSGWSRCYFPIWYWSCEIFPIMYRYTIESVHPSHGEYLIFGDGERYLLGLVVALAVVHAYQGLMMLQ
jgi:hypothetical protein